MLGGTVLIVLTLISLSYCRTTGHLQTSLKCEPNSYVIVGCNVCRCDDKGTINKEFCTEKSCDNNQKLQVDEFRRNYNVNGSCDPGNWYSSEPCQLCYCVAKSKLLCNSNSDRTKLVLGKFDFSVCGPSLLQEANELMVEEKDTRYKRKRKWPQRISRKLKRLRPQSPTKTTESSSDEKLYEDIVDNSKRNNKHLNTIRNYRESESDDEGNYSDKQVGLTIPPYYEADVPDHDRNSKPDANESEKESFSKTLLTGIKNKINSKERPSILGYRIPEIFNKVLNIEMRKSMLSLDNKKQCSPGITYSSGCKKCFCLKNGKIICKNLCK